MRYFFSTRVKTPFSNVARAFSGITAPGRKDEPAEGAIFPLKTQVFNLLAEPSPAFDALDLDRLLLSRIVISFWASREARPQQ